MDLDAVVALFERIITPLYGEDEFGVVSDAGLGVVEAMTDDWTLYVECRPKGLAWLALDVEPESAAEARTLRTEVMGPNVVRALSDVDLLLDGALSAALAATDDLLSTELVAAMAEVRATPRDLQSETPQSPKT